MVGISNILSLVWNSYSLLYIGVEMKDSRSTILGIKRPPSIDSFMVMIYNDYYPKHDIVHVIM